MSRRHRNNNNISNEPQQAESHEDGRLRDRSSDKSTSKEIYSVLDALLCVKATNLFAEKIAQIVAAALERKEVEVDNNWVKIPLSAFEKLGNDWKQRYKAFANPQLDEEPVASKKGRNPIKRLFSTIADSKVVKYYHKTKEIVKKKCLELYESITQYSVSFLYAANKVFSPDDNPYGKISHYHRLLVNEVPELPTRKTLNNWFKWFEEWKPAVIYEDRRLKKERVRHRLWESLIERIRDYLMKLAPQYAVAN